MIIHKHDDDTQVYLRVSRYADVAQVPCSKHAIFPQVTILLLVIGSQQLQSCTHRHIFIVLTHTHIHMHDTQNATATSFTVIRNAVNQRKKQYNTKCTINLIKVLCATRHKNRSFWRCSSQPISWHNNEKRLNKS